MDRKAIFWGLMAAVFLALVISPFASPWPDGLEKVAEDKGFLEKGEVEPLVTSPIPDYAWPGIENEKVATSFAGIAGTLFMFAGGYCGAKLIRRKEA